MANSLYWYDFETTGVSPATDRVIQFAGVRTDLDFNIIAEPDVFYCQLANDVLPHPEAALVTGISPQLTLQKGLIERDFIARIHEQFCQPQTCVVGYNSIRFDDEFTRHLLYRNFYDPYAREWKSGNSRWDLIDVVRLTHALRPDGINWPSREDGSVSFKLEALCQSNNIVHESAHDALSDVYATIGLAKLIKDKQPKLYTWAFELKNKKTAAQQLKLGEGSAVVHISGMYPSSKDCLAIVMPVIRHPINQNGVVVYDLSVDPQALINLPTEELHKRLYARSDELKEGEHRLGIKTVHLNKSPMLAPIGTLTPDVIKKLQIDLEHCEKNRQAILNANITNKLEALFSINTFEKADDPDLMLYSGGFFSALDARNMAHIRSSSLEELGHLDLPFEDERLEEMLLRYKARNYPQILNEQQRNVWQQYRYNKLTQTPLNGDLTFELYFEKLDELIAQEGWSDKEQQLLADLIEYGETLEEGF